jgi:hypothetical protein
MSESRIKAIKVAVAIVLIGAATYFGGPSAGSMAAQVVSAIFGG